MSRIASMQAVWLGPFKEAIAGRVSQFFAGLFLLAITVGVYQQVWRAGYIWDDDVYVTENPLLTAADGMQRIWFSLDSPSQYFPLVYSAFRLEHALWGFNPAGYHWVNILLHAVNVLLFWRLLLGLGIPGAWLGAALFGLHPVQVESVAWITELKNVLMGFFFLLTLLCWVRFIKEETRARHGYYVAALFFYALALFSKTTACTLPAALLLMLWLKRKPLNLLRWAQITPFVISAALMGGVTIWWERYHQGTRGGPFTVGFMERVLIASRALWFYLGKLIWPQELCFSYPHWTMSPANPLDYVWLGATLAAALVVYFLRRYTGRSVETALVFFFLTLSPVLGFVMLWTFRYSWVADHYQYLACIGPLALFAAGLKVGAARLMGRGNWAVALGGVLLLLPLSVRTWKQGAIYENAETLWRATLAVNPRSALAHNSLGTLIGANNGNIQDEMEHYRQAIESDPNSPEGHNNLGFALAKLGRVDQALSEYQKAIASDPRYLIVHGNLATLLLQQGRGEEAVIHLQEILARGPANAALERSLGDILSGLKRPEEALAHWRRSLELEPKNAELQAIVGRALAGTGQLEGALPYLRAAAQLAPQDTQAHFNYGSALSLLRRFAEAVPEFQETLRIEPQLHEAHLSLAICYLQINQVREAATEFEKALELKPEDVSARKNLAVLLRQLGRNTEAEAQAQRAAELEAQAAAPPP